MSNGWVHERTKAKHQKKCEGKHMRKCEEKLESKSEVKTRIRLRRNIKELITL
jgi:hypothetical protein